MSPPELRDSSDSVTPSAISGDCSPMDTDTPQVVPSNPFSEESKPISIRRRRTMRGIST